MNGCFVPSCLIHLIRWKPLHFEKNRTTRLEVWHTASQNSRTSVGLSFDCHPNFTTHFFLIFDQSLQIPLLTLSLLPPLFSAFNRGHNLKLLLCFVFKKNWRTQVPFVRPLIPCFGLLVMSALGFKPKQGGFPRLRASSPSRKGFLRFAVLHLYV